MQRIWSWILVCCAATIGVVALAGCGGGSGASSPLGGGGGGGGGGADAGQLTLSPSTATLAPDGAITLTATSADTANMVDPRFTWKVREGAPGGSLTEYPSKVQARYYAPKVAGVYHVDLTSDNYPSAIATATITVTEGGVEGSIMVMPVSLPVAQNGTVALAATVNGPTDKTVTWRVSENNGGTFSPGVDSQHVVYHTPATAGIYHIVVTSTVDPAINGMLVIPVGTNNAKALCISPATVSLRTGDRQHFCISAIGTPAPLVHWEVVDQQGGTYTTGENGSIEYQTPSEAGIYHLNAVCTGDDDLFAQATIAVRPSEDQLMNEEWLLGTWEGTIPSSAATFAGTKIRLVLNDVSIQSDGIDGSYRYAYAGTVTWDCGGAQQWNGVIVFPNDLSSNTATWEDSVTDWMETVHISATQDTTHTISLSWSDHRGSVTSSPSSLSCDWSIHWGQTSGSSSGYLNNRITLEKKSASVQ
ncbi:MAG TPA: hypothetical protein VHV83_13520 [Armatimonadota bacterium]|nr:hypothetical protein [Armatimonadota bacterium]